MTQAKTTKLQLVVDVVVKHDCHEGRTTVGNKAIFADAKVGAMRWKK